MLDNFFGNAAVFRISVWPAGQREASERGGTAGSAAGHRKAAAVCTGGAVFLWFAAVGCAVFPAERIISALDWVFFPLPAGAFLPADCDKAVYGVGGPELQQSLDTQPLVPGTDMRSACNSFLGDTGAVHCREKATSHRQIWNTGNSLAAGG